MEIINYKALNPDLQLFCEALDMVEEKYFKEKLTKLDGNLPVDSGEYRTNERNFVSELKDHYKNKLGDRLNNMYLQMDPPKAMVFRDDCTIKKYERTYNAVFSTQFQDEFYRVPDLVFHGGPEDMIRQELISEVKISEQITNSMFNIDLFKMSVYHNELNFKLSVFVVCNQSVDKVKSLLNEYLNNRYSLPTRSGLFIVVKESFNVPSVVLNPLEKF